MIEFGRPRVPGRRILIAAEPLSVEHGEITDKGYVNQRAVLDRRSDLIGSLYARSPGAGVIEIGS